MSTPASPSVVLSYAVPGRQRRRWWRKGAFGVLVAVLIAAPFAHLSGLRVVGFEYGVFVDTSTTVCPDQVVSQAGDSIRLADGRAFKLDADPRWISAGLARAEDRVFVDTANGVVYGRFRYLYCGFDRPERSQLITIPIVRKTLPSHGREMIATVRKPTAPPAGG